MSNQLTANDHSRNSAGLKYVYPVISRRAGGLSIGINFNPNNACNWRCVYCQVPELTRGAAPEMDFGVLEQELRGFLSDVQHGDFFERFQVPPEQRVIKDIAISGNGEPTSLKSFARAVQLIVDIAQECGVLPQAKLVLISNGSLVQQAEVQAGLAIWSAHGGELWFKLDSATEQGRLLINNVSYSQTRFLESLTIASRLCRTKLQTCVFHYQQAGGSQEQQAYLQLLQQLREIAPTIEEILLYRIARESHQPEAEQLQAIPEAELEAWRQAMQHLGFRVSLY